MRLPFPERIVPWHAVCFATLLCMAELLEGTQPVFAGCVFLYILMATAAFNMAGGLYRATGTYIFANASLSLIIAVGAKVFLGEPADSNLRDPMTTIMVYTAGMGAMLLAVIVSRKLMAKVPILERGEVSDNNRQIGIGCLVLGMAMPFIGGLLGGGDGSVSSALNQFTEFFPLGLVLVTYDEIRSTGGRRSLSPIFVVCGLYCIIFGGILGTSKQALFTPVAAYIAVCGALRYKFRPSSIAAMAIMLGFMTYYLVPYAQIVRNYTRSLETWGERIDVNIFWLSHLDEVRAQYNQGDDLTAVERGPHYYTEDYKFLERLSMVGTDDSLINVADNGDKFGYKPIVDGMANIVPHFLWPDKPSTNYANVYGHETGVLGDDDTLTSISFGPSADAYNMGGFLGVFLLLPVVLTIMFTVMDSVAGSIKKSPWGLAYTVYLFHAAPESSLAVCIYIAVQMPAILILTVFAARYAMPIVGSIFYPERRRSILVRKVRTFPKTAVTPLSPDPVNETV